VSAETAFIVDFVEVYLTVDETASLSIRTEAHTVESFAVLCSVVRDFLQKGQLLYLEKMDVNQDGKLTFFLLASSCLP
jgi:hypothetical protein